MSKKTQQEAKQPDAFISYSDKLLKFVETNIKKILTVAVAVAAVGAAVVAVKYVQKKSETEALSKLYKAEKMLSDKAEALMKDRQAIADKKNKALEAKTKKTSKKDIALIKPDEEIKTPETLASNYGPIISEFETVIQETMGKKASYMASLTLSQLYVDFGEAKKAMQALNSVSKPLKKKHFFYGLIHNRMGSALASLGNCEKANIHFSKVLEAKSQAYLHADALLGKAICLETLKKTDEAKALYGKLMADFSETDSGRSAKTYLRLLSLKTLNGGQE